MAKTQTPPPGLKNLKLAPADQFYLASFLKNLSCQLSPVTAFLNF